MSSMQPKKSNAVKIIVIIGVILGVLSLLGLILVFVAFSFLKKAADDFDYDSYTDGYEYDSTYDSTFGSTDVTAEQAAQITLVLDQYDAVVAATASDIPWSTYLTELDVFIDMLNTLYGMDPDPALSQAISLMTSAYVTYSLSVDTATDEVLDSEGVQQGYDEVTQGEEYLFDYLSARGY